MELFRLDENVYWKSVLMDFTSIFMCNFQFIHSATQFVEQMKIQLLASNYSYSMTIVVTDEIRAILSFVCINSNPFQRIKFHLEHVINSINEIQLIRHFLIDF